VAFSVVDVSADAFVAYVREDLEAVSRYLEETVVGGVRASRTSDSARYAAIQFVAARKIAKKFDKNATVLGEKATARRRVDEILEKLPWVVALAHEENVFRELGLAHYVPVFDENVLRLDTTDDTALTRHTSSLSTTTKKEDLSDEYPGWSFYLDFTATYVAYGFVYACRRALAAAKEPLKASLSTASLSGLDTVLLVSYVFMQFFVAQYGDDLKRFASPSSIVTFAVFSAAAATFLTGLAAPNAFLMALPWALNGVAQALVYPYVCVLLSTQIPAKSRGRVMGSWNTCTATGGVLGAAISAIALKRRGYRGAFDAPAGATFLFGLVLFAVLGRNTGAPPPSQKKKKTTTTDGHRVAVWQMARVPTVSCAYSLLKPIRYLFLFWHNYYLTAVLGYDVNSAALVEATETAFALVGGLAFGAATDRVSPFVLFFACLLGLALGLALFYPVSQLGLAPNLAIVAFVSALVGAVDNLASGLTAAALVDHNETYRGGAASIASVCSFLSACGTLGTIAHSRLLRTLVNAAEGWATIFGLVALQALGCALLVFPMAIDDLRRAKRNGLGTTSGDFTIRRPHEKEKTT